MRIVAFERLSKLFSSSSEAPGIERKRGRQVLEESSSQPVGWLIVFLLAMVLYATIWSLQLAVTEPSLGFLTIDTALGLALGIFLARRRLSRWLSHGIALIGALLLAYWHGTSYYQSGASLTERLTFWFSTLFSGGVSNDNTTFVFFISFVAILLAYSSAWLVYRTRRPWLVVAANAVVLLISMNGASQTLVFFFVIFVLASLLLLLRLNLNEWMVRWQRQGLRFADDLGWDVMQAGAFISIGILLFAWILPATYIDPTLAQVWNAQNGPISQVTNAWNRLFAIQAGGGDPGRGNFQGNLVLGGNPNLSDEIVFTVESESGAPPYLAFVSYDVYDHGQWSISQADVTRDAIKENTILAPKAEIVRTVELSITVQNPPAMEHSYIPAPYELISTSLPARILFGKGGDPIAWLSTRDTLPAGITYQIISAISGADTETLKSVPLPVDAPPYMIDDGLYGSEPPITAYEAALLDTYLQLPENLDPRITALAEEQAGAEQTMYEKVEALERFLRSNYQYSVNISPPGDGQDPVSWFLFDERKGFCNYYSSAMVLMARSLGIPARVAVGYRQGTSNEGTYSIRGKDAHSWVQVYFAGYGWVDFEPTAAFPAFDRPAPADVQNDDAVATPETGDANVPLPTTPFEPGMILDEGNGDGEAPGSAQTSLNQTIIALSGSFLLLVICSMVIVSVWWRRLFQRHSLAVQVYGRIYTLASLAGIRWQSSQTPHEYLEQLAATALRDPEYATTLKRLEDIYVRECWADPDSPEHPQRNGDSRELPLIWHRLRQRLLLYVLQHPRFLSWLPLLVRRLIVSLWEKMRSRKYEEDL